MGHGAPKTLKLPHPLSSVGDAPLRRLDLQLLSRWGHHTQIPLSATEQAYLVDGSAV